MDGGDACESVCAGLSSTLKRDFLTGGSTSARGVGAFEFTDSVAMGTRLAAINDCITLCLSLTQEE